MANTLTGLFETHILPATAALQAPLMLRNSMVKKIYVQAQPQPGIVGQTINVNIPAASENDVVDIGNGPVQITDGTHTSVSLTVNQNKSVAKRIPDFDRARSPLDFRNFYLAPAIESVLQKINRSVCNLTTTSNFNVHSSITGGADVFTRVTVAAAWANLVGVGVPITPGDAFFVTGHVPYSNMIGDDANKWISESVVGINAAEMVQQTARLMPAFGAELDYDPMFYQPTAGSVYAGLFFNRHAIALVPVVPPSEDKPHVQETYYTPDGTGLTFRIQYWYDPREQAWILHVHCAYALAVVRPNFGSYVVST